MPDEPTGSAPAEAPPQAAPQPPAQPASPAQQQEEMFSVPVSRLRQAGYEGNFDAMMKHAQAYRQASNDGVFTSHQKVRQLDQEAKALGFDSLEEAWTEYAKAVRAYQGQQGAPQQPQGQPPTEGQGQVLTAEQMRQAIRDEMQAQRDRMESESREQQTRASEQRARDAEDRYALDELKKAGFEIDTAKPLGRRDLFLYSAFRHILGQIRQEDLPAYLGKDESQDALRREASPQQLARAAEEFHKFMAEWSQETVAAFAKRQQTVPGATAGAGPGGPRQPKVDWNSMTREQQIKFATAHIPPDREPQLS